MLNYQNVLKTIDFQMILLDREFDIPQSFEWKIYEKTNSNTDIDLDLILGWFWHHFWSQNRFKICSKAI